MLQLGREADLALEALGADRGREVRVQHLDRHLALVLEVLREEDGGHAAPAELALDCVAVAERAAEPGQRVRFRPRAGRLLRLSRRRGSRLR